MSAIPEQSPAETSFHFVLCRHEPEMADQVAQAVGDCDVIAIEAVGHDQELRGMFEQLATLYVKEGITGEQREQNRAVSERAGIRSEFDFAVLDHFLDSNKQIRLIDASRDDAAYESIERVYAAEEAYMRGLNRGVPTTKLKQLLSGEIEISADSYVQREELMIDQLTMIAEEYPAARIGVLIGAVHTGVQHAISKHFTADRLFVTEPKDGQDQAAGNRVDAMKMMYEPRLEAARRLRLGVSKDVGEKAVEYMLLQDMLLLLFGQNNQVSPKDLSASEVHRMLETAASLRRQQIISKSRHA